MNDIPANLLYSPNELERWLDDTSAPLSDDEHKYVDKYRKQKEQTMENKSTEMNENENKTTNNIPLDLTGLPADLTCDQEELEKWLDLVPPTDEEIEIMSKYFDSEKLKCGEYVQLPNRIETLETETTSLEMPDNSAGKALLKGTFIAIAVLTAYHIGLSFFPTVVIVSILAAPFFILLDSGYRKLHKK